MRFSEAFQVARGPSDEWFDPHLAVDTALFVDPLLLFQASGELWGGAHGELVGHFAYCYELIAKGGRQSSNSAKAARRLLTFPEPAEFGLGYTEHGTRGSGSGAGHAQSMMDGIAIAIAAGLVEPEHIEEIGILNLGIGSDRISDAACNVLKHRFVTYTQEVVRRHSIETESHELRNARCVPELGRWLHETVNLPTNPLTGKPILLCPQSFLNLLPVLNAYDWFDSGFNDDIRSSLNLQVGQRVRKEHIVRYARQHPERVREWAREQTSRQDLVGYDFRADPRGVVNWDGPSSEYARAHPITEIQAVDDIESLKRLVGLALDRYRHFIEQQGGWRLLWNQDGSEKPEEAAQLLFLGVAQVYLRLFDVELDREVELGRGAVDFKISRGTSIRLLVELKKAHNGKFWNGLDAQLTTYLHSDQCNEGWFVAIRYRNNKASEIRMNELPGRVKLATERTGMTIGYSAIDARRPLSASNL